jgi:cellobiose transport system permease protein
MCSLEREGLWMTVLAGSGRRAEALPARQSRRRLGRLGSRAGYAYVAPFFVVFAAFGLYPLLYTGWVSLHNVNLENLHHSSWIGLHNYVALWHNQFFWNAFRNTITIGIISTVPQLCMALGLAQLLNYKMRGRTFFRVAMLMPYATSVVASTLIFAELFGRDYGLINWFLHFFGVHHIYWTNGSRWQSQIALASIVTWRWTGYNALIYLAGMQSIPTDQYEAAAIDGANRWQQFWFVTVPSLRPTILFTIVISTIGAMQMFAEPYLFAGDGTTNGGGQHQFQTLALFMYQQGWTNFHLGQAAATAWTMLFIILVLAGVNAALARGRSGRN